MGDKAHTYAPIEKDLLINYLIACVECCTRLDILEITVLFACIDVHFVVHGHRRKVLVPWRRGVRRHIADE